MNALYLFASTFCVVFALGLQSQLVNNGFWRGAMLNSFVISTANLVLLKLAPDASGMEVAGYLCGGPIGIATSMWAFSCLKKRGLG